MYAFKLEVPHFFDSRYFELGDESSDEGSSIGVIPMVRERTVVFVLVEAYPLGVLLDEAEHDAGRPLLGVEVVELSTLTNLVLFRMSVELRVGGPNDQMQERHPSTGKVLDVSVDLVVDCLPEEFNAQINKLVVLSLIEEFQQAGQDALEEVEKVLSLLFSDAELKASRDGEQDVEKRHQVLLLSDAFDDGGHGQPLAVLHADNDSEDLFVELDELVVAIAPDDCQQDGVLDGLFFRLVHLVLLGLPVELDVILELDESSLLHFHLQAYLVHDLHEGHRKTCLTRSVPVLVAASARKAVVSLRVLESPMKVLRKAATKLSFEGRLVISTNYFTN